MSLPYTVDGITVTYLGRTEAAENQHPLITEAQHGLDSLTRNFIAARPVFKAFIEALVKGSSYEYNEELYYLTNWSEHGTKLYPEVQLQYLGLSEGTPPPVGDDDFSIQSLTVSAQITEEGDLIGVERQIEYLAAQTTWRYIREARPLGAEVGVTATGINPTILRSVITVNGGVNDGRVYAGANAPANYVVATTPGISDVVLSLRATEIYATPFFEVEEVVGRMFVG